MHVRIPCCHVLACHISKLHSKKGAMQAISFPHCQEVDSFLPAPNAACPSLVREVLVLTAAVRSSHTCAFRSIARAARLDRHSKRRCWPTRCVAPARRWHSWPVRGDAQHHQGPQAAAQACIQVLSNTVMCMLLYNKQIACARPWCLGLSCGSSHSLPSPTRASTRAPAAAPRYVHRSCNMQHTGFGLPHSTLHACMGFVHGRRPAASPQRCLAGTASSALTS